MPTGLQLMLLAGALVGFGVALVGVWLVPAQPDAADAIAHLSRRRPLRPVLPTGDPDDLQQRLGLLALRLLPAAVWVKTPQRELALLRKPLAAFYGEKVVFALVPLVAVPILTVLLSMVVALPWPVPVLGSLALAGGLWFLPNLFVIEDAKVAREDFNRELASYIDLVAMERGNGSGPRQAMEIAARMGDAWVFQRVNEELARSRWSGEPPWDALHALAENLGLPELDELADIMRLSGEEGAQVYATLRARSTALRNALLNDELAKAHEANERMSMPASLLGVVFLVILIGPALMRLI
jgi:Flp pilus assembly protein TadB